MLIAVRFIVRCALRRSSCAAVARIGGLLLLVVVSVAGCAQDGRASLEADGQVLRVVHVVSEQHLLAGFARRPGESVTAARELQPLLVGVVEGYPMVGQRVPAGGADDTSPAAVPWVVLMGRGYAGEPNVISPGVDVAAGDGVLLGGFVLPEHGVSAIEYLQVPPSIIRGRVLDVEVDDGGTFTRYWVGVPAGEYSGFVGGPAASCDADGTLHIWGMIVRWEPQTPGAASPGCRLEVARLLPGML